MRMLYPDIVFGAITSSGESCLRLTLVYSETCAIPNGPTPSHYLLGQGRSPGTTRHHSEALFHGQTCFLRAERNDILSFSGYRHDDTLKWTLRTIKDITRESVWHSLADQHLRFALQEGAPWGCVLHSFEMIECRRGVPNPIFSADIR
jgi:hypothetical protein